MDSKKVYHHISACGGASHLISGAGWLTGAFSSKRVQSTWSATCDILYCWREFMRSKRRRLIVNPPAPFAYHFGLLSKHQRKQSVPVTGMAPCWWSNAQLLIPAQVKLCHVSTSTHAAFLCDALCTGVLTIILSASVDLRTVMMIFALREWFQVICAS